MKLENRSLLLFFIGLVSLASLVSVPLTSSHAREQITFERPSPSPTPTPTPAPTPAPAPLSTPAPTQTIETLQSRIRQRLFSPAVSRGRIGIKVVSLSSGKVIFEQDSEKYFVPASNMKNFTVAAALEKLSPDFRFVTSVYANSMPDAAGTIAGDVRILGRGDVTMSPGFNNGDPYKGIENLADKIVAAGVKRIEGSIVGDESYFSGSAIPSTWEWDDLQWYYGAEISALPVNDGAVELSVSPGVTGGPCPSYITPHTSLVQIVNLCTTTAASAKRTLQIKKLLDRNILEISGTLPVGDSGFRGYVTVTRPADLFVALLKQRLELKGVTITGGTRLQPAKVASDPAQVEITRLESPPLSVIAARTMKPSQNMYTETLLWTLGEQVGRRNGSPGTSADLGLKVVKEFLVQAGIGADQIVPYDGSGMSRHNLVTPSAVASLYSYMAKQSRYSAQWRDSLTIGGIDGTLANRFKGTAAAANIRGKTGTLDQVSALSGYLTTRGGEQLILSILVNGVPDTRTRTSLIDDIVVSLANFDGRVE